MTWRQVRRPKSAAACMVDESALGTENLPIQVDLSGGAAHTRAQCTGSVQAMIANEMKGTDTGAVGVRCEEDEKSKPVAEKVAQQPAKRPRLTGIESSHIETLAHRRSQETSPSAITPPSLTETCIHQIAALVGSAPSLFHHSSRQVWELPSDLGQKLFQQSLPQVRDLETFSNMLHPDLDTLNLEDIIRQLPIQDALVCSSIRCPNIQRLFLPSRTSDQDVLPALVRLGGSPFVQLKELHLHGSNCITGAAFEGLLKSAGELHTLSLAGCCRLLTPDLSAVLKRRRLSLRALDLSNCTALDKSLFDFLPPGLQRLLLRNCWRLFQGSLQGLIRSCPLLEELDLSFDGVTTAGLGPFAAMALADLKHLTVLDLSNQRNVGGVALDKLRKANPRLQLVQKAATSMLVDSHQTRDQIVREVGSSERTRSEQLTTVH